MTAFFEARNLSYAYPGGPPVVRGVTLSVKPGSLTAIIGANGSGKSTFVRMLAGLLQPRSGEVLLDGAPLERFTPRHRAKEIAYMPQSTTAAFPFRALEVVLSGRTPHLAAFALEGSRDLTVAMEALESAGAAHLSERPINALSGGERQMVILARALAQEPRLLLLDEPSASLDLKHRADLLRTLARLRDQRGLSAVMITHDVQLAGSMFDWIVAMRAGEVVAQGTPEEVLQTGLLRDIYEEPNVHAGRIGSQTLVWIEP
jgi:iron complex transport system ATP-binding protein